MIEWKKTQVEEQTLFDRIICPCGVRPARLVQQVIRGTPLHHALHSHLSHITKKSRQLFIEQSKFWNSELSTVSEGDKQSIEATV